MMSAALAMSALQMQQMQPSPEKAIAAVLLVVLYIGTMILLTGWPFRSAKTRS